MSGSATLAYVTASAHNLAGHLGQMHRAPVVCVVDRGVDAIVAMFGTWLAGGVYVPINSRLPDTELHRQLAECNPAMVITTGAQAARIPQSFSRAVTLDTGDWSILDGADPWSGTRFPEGTALVMRTSGTTGAAKPVLLEHTGVLDGIDTVIGQLRGRSASSNDNRPAMPNLVPTSLALWAGIWNTLFALRLSAPVVLLDRFDALDYMSMVKKFGIKSTVLAPAMMTMLLTDSRVADLSPLRLVRSVTAPLVPDQARRFHDRFGVDVLNSYGQTELGGEVVGWTAADIREFGDSKLGAVGRPHPGVSIRILDGAQQDLPAETVGEVFVRSPFSARESDLDSDRFVDGYMRTGDLGRVDHDGFLWLEGRVSDMINRGGLKIVPQDVETALRTYPDVADACVAGVPDERLGEVPVAWILAVPGTQPDEMAVRAFLRERIPPYQVPVAVRVLDNDFPRNEIGKILRRELVASYIPATDPLKGSSGELRNA
ncbi:class I adenylate-forming enzyme family protein [Nocardia sp.]|uniref:class I adenylate-forming enzyme family protein n=1 Tax=Nocardia sp. TaxID=1821 RepID=UPI003F8E53A4